MAQLKITLKKSKIGALKKQKQTLEALGLHKTNSEVVQEDNAAMRGMIFRVRHLVEVEEIA